MLKKDRLQEKTKTLERYFRDQAAEIPEVKNVKGSGLMLGLEFDFEIGSLRK